MASEMLVSCLLSVAQECGVETHEMICRVGWEKLLSLVPYNDRFRAMRKAMARCIGSTASMDKFHPLQEIEIRRVMLRILGKPQDLMQHMRK